MLKAPLPGLRPDMRPVQELQPDAKTFIRHPSHQAALQTTCRGRTGAGKSDAHPSREASSMPEMPLQGSGPVQQCQATPRSPKSEDDCLSTQHMCANTPTPGMRWTFQVCLEYQCHVHPSRDTALIGRQAPGRPQGSHGMQLCGGQCSALGDSVVL